VIIGTRPEIIKMSPVIRALEKAELEFFILHTGQHYSYSLDDVFIQQLKLPQPDYNLDVGSRPPVGQTAKIMEGLAHILVKEKPDLVLVLGDTNTVLAGAIATAKMKIKLGHIEAGLRSYDRSMPEELNRILADNCSDLMFTPTENARQILLREGFAPEKIFMTGNTIVDAVYKHLEFAQADSREVSGKYILATVHRTENVDDKDKFALIITCLRNVAKKFNLPVIYPAHPHSTNKAKEYGLEFKDITVIPPTDYLHFLKLESKAEVILTDSGGVQEEACILGVPCITLRDNTERPETLDIGANVLAGTNPEKVLECVNIMLGKDNNWGNPFGDGKAGERIAEVIKSL